MVAGGLGCGHIGQAPHMAPQRIGCSLAAQAQGDMSPADRVTAQVLCARATAAAPPGGAGCAGGTRGGLWVMPQGGRLPTRALPLSLVNLSFCQGGPISPHQPLQAGPVTWMCGTPGYLGHRQGVHPGLAPNLVCPPGGLRTAHTCPHAPPPTSQPPALHLLSPAGASQLLLREQHHIVSQSITGMSFVTALRLLRG
jgi:hypothetical protein